MSQTVEAIIDTQGRVHLLETIRLGKKHKALVTILDEEENQADRNSIAGSIEILDEDLESGSRKISRMFHDSLKKSADDLKD
jgi:hypothetical protein